MIMFALFALPAAALSWSRPHHQWTLSTRVRSSRAVRVSIIVVGSANTWRDGGGSFPAL
jgi:hypothetical protein